MKKRNKKTFVAYLNTNLVSAFDIFCSENQVLKSEVISILLLEFLLQTKDLPESAKKELSQIKLEEILAHKLSPKSSLIKENIELKKQIESIEVLINLMENNLDNFVKKILQQEDTEL
jgi:hypothetical protein